MWEEDHGRWNSPERDRAARLFRSHVDTPKNRLKGRTCVIKREPCWFCAKEAEEMDALLMSEDPLYFPPLDREMPAAPFHHVDYRFPFKGIFCCNSHHRKLDHGSLTAPAAALRDFAQAVRQAIAETRRSRLNLRGPAGRWAKVDRTEDPEREEISCKSVAA